MALLKNNENILFQIKEGMCSKGCSYCYEKGKPATEISLDVIKKWFSYLSELKIENFEIAGSEPTEHSQFKKIMELAQEKNLKATIYTGGLHLEQLEYPAIKKIYLHETSLESEEYMSKINGLLDSGKILGLRVNFDSDELEEKEIAFEFLRRIRKDLQDKVTFRYSFTAPNEQGGSVYFTPKRFKQIKKRFLDFCEDFHKKYPKIKMSAARPIFRCCFTDDEMKRYAYAGLDMKCNMEFTVYPDGKIGLCPPVEHLIHKREVKNAEDVKKAIRGLRDDLTKKYAKKSFEECEGCIHLEDLTCHGGCITYKFDRE